MSATIRHTWKSIRDIIHGRVLDSTYAPGDKLPRDEDLASQLGCARNTVHRAMRDLADSGIVQRRRKGGTRIRQDPVTRKTVDIPITRLEVEQQGRVYGYRLINKNTAETPPSIVAKFGLMAPQKMLRIQALHLADQVPYIFEDRWVSIQTVPDIVQVNLAQDSANEWLVRNKPYDRCELRFYATTATDYYSKLLQAPVNDALLVIDRTTWIGVKPITNVQAVTAPGYQLLSHD